MNELQIQTQLVEAAREDNGHAFKCNNRFLKGVLDLSIQMPKMQHVYLEVKFAKKFVRGNQVALALTPHQSRFMMLHQLSGGVAGWLMVVQDGRPGEFAMVANKTWDKEQTLFHTCSWIHKERGGPWPIRRIVAGLQPA